MTQEEKDKISKKIDSKFKSGKNPGSDEGIGVASMKGVTVYGPVDPDEEIGDGRTGHAVSEVICINCKYRWIRVSSETVLLKYLECPNCNQAGYVIETGQKIIQ